MATSGFTCLWTLLANQDGVQQPWPMRLISPILSLLSDLTTIAHGWSAPTSDRDWSVLGWPLGHTAVPCLVRSDARVKLIQGNSPALGARECGCKPFNVAIDWNFYFEAWFCDSLKWCILYYVAYTNQAKGRRVYILFRIRQFDIYSENILFYQSLNLNHQIILKQFNLIYK